MNTLRSLKTAFVAIQKMRRLMASKITNSCNKFLFRKEIRNRIKRTQRRLEATIIIQRWYIIEKERRWHITLNERQLMVSRLMASKIIQRNFKRKLAYLQLLVLRRKKEELIALQQEKATVLCRFGRLLAAKNRVRQRREEYEEEIKKAMMLRIWAATEIEAAWRGKLGRDRSKTSKIVRSQRWKALWSETEQRVFYYK